MSPLSLVGHPTLVSIPDEDGSMISRSAWLSPLPHRRGGQPVTTSCTTNGSLDYHDPPWWTSTYMTLTSSVSPGGGADGRDRHSDRRMAAAGRFTVLLDVSMDDAAAVACLYAALRSRRRPVSTRRRPPESWRSSRRFRSRRRCPGASSRRRLARGYFPTRPDDHTGLAAGQLRTLLIRASDGGHLRTKRRTTVVLTCPP